MNVGFSFKEFISSKPGLKYLFFGGKGGVGKTVVSSAAACLLSELGFKTLIGSTNPVHSLSSAFDQDFWGKGITPIKGAKNLYALEIDVSKTVGRYKDDLVDKISMFLKYADIPIKPGPFVEVATTNPAFEEAAMFDDMIDVMLKGEFDVYVFDTAPVAHTYRLLGMSKVYEAWLAKMIKSRQEALSLRLKLSFRKEKVAKEIAEDPLLKSAIEMKKSTDMARRLLTDPERTAFFFVTLPLALPIAVVERFVTWVKAFNIPTGGVIVNCVVPKEKFDLEKASPYLVHKIEEQEHYLKVIHEKFPGEVLAHLPLMETEVRGLEMIAHLAEALKHPSRA